MVSWWTFIGFIDGEGHGDRRDGWVEAAYSCAGRRNDLDDGWRKTEMIQWSRFQMTWIAVVVAL